ncbi:MAG: ATP-binding cassette domain-containing protein [Austwickia sp.]|jgi:ABC-2 type transport system ATP-binding protein|nr:ATP-binding cassette domain-containing protein [Austwickia sp.]MBK8437087.1 ATP-binding cassette domain-containing protein [Austwickia sp.]MBK9102322.1 ATP-binding cassette domain-containing protein [Austwickia sp.]
MLELTEVTRRYGDLVAVDRVSFQVAAGSLTGFVGGNGAGKTTTMRMIMGVLAMNGGEVRWAGHPITAADRKRFGYMPEERGLYPKQPVLDQLIYLGRLHGLTASAARASATAHLERFGLAERAKAKVETLSLGNQQRVQIIASVMSQPTCLILDEPFSGLDPMAVDAMADVLREHACAGVPVLFSSHQLDLVDRLCDHLIILAKGRVAAQGTADELRATGTLRHRLVLGGDAGWLRQVPGIHVADVESATAIVEIIDPAAEQPMLAAALQRGGIREYAALVPSLSEIYREVAS